MFRLLCLFCLLLVHPLIASETEKEPRKAILILDASGSMWGKVDGRAKIEIAREVVRDLLGNLSPELHLGLMTYGHRHRGDCSDIELLIPPGKVDPAVFLKAVNGLTPKGKTPLTDSLIQATEILRKEEGKATVILVSDGLETCGKDPCKAVDDLKKQGIDLTAHVVGFDLSAKDQQSIRCVADSTGGLFLAAHDAASLKNALETAVRQTIEPSTPPPAPQPTPEPTPTPKPKVTSCNVTLRTFLVEGGDEVQSFYRIEFLEDENAKEIAGGRKLFQLKPGSYTVRATWQSVVLDTQIEVPEAEDYKVDLVYNAGQLTVQAIFSEGNEPAPAFYKVYEPANTMGNRREVAAGSSGQFGLPAGKYVVSASLGQSSQEQEVEVKAGESTKATINLKAGLLEVTAFVGEIEEVQDAFFTVLSPGGIANPEPKQVAANSLGRFHLPAGKYIVRVRWGQAEAEDKVEIQGGERTDKKLTIQGGLLVANTVDASGAEIGAFVKVFASGGAVSTAEKQVSASSTKIHRLPVGKYRVETKIGDQTVSAEVEVKLGERSEVTLKP